MSREKTAIPSGGPFARIFEGGAEFGEREFAYDSRGQRVAQIKTVEAIFANANAKAIGNRFGALAHRGLHIVARGHGFSPFFVGASS
jgi:hypothetical protein